jgi:5-methylcytosine-specific restriction endonuclease McrA
MDKKIILKIKELRNGGLSYGEISKLLGVTKSQARYYYLFDIDKREIKEEEKKVFEKEVCENALKTSSFYELCKKVDRWPCRENIITLKKILDKHKIDYSNFINANKSHKYTIPKRAINEYLKKDCEYRISTNHLKIRLLKEKIKEYRCEKCGNTEWNGKEIPLQLHHINGDSNDNRLENLQILCPNCHAQTDNFSRPKVIKEKNKCIVCGAEISNKAKYCRECYHKTEDGKRYRQDKLLKVSKEELIEEYKKCGSFKILGKKYGVSDKTISKWFGKYDLPTKAVELRKYIIDKFGYIKWENFSKNTIYLRKFQQDNFKKIALISEDGKIEKIYNSPQELMRDGYIPKNVYRVCKGTLKTHHKRIFKYI